MKIDINLLKELEHYNYSESEIASYFGVSRMGLYKYRKLNNCPREQRSHKNRFNSSAEDRRLINTENQRNYRQNLINQGKTTNRGRNNKMQRKIALKILGRYLKSGEVMHHIDNNPSNNDHKNLVICTQEYHRAVFHTRRAEKAMGITR